MLCAGENLRLVMGILPLPAAALVCGCTRQRGAALLSCARESCGRAPSAAGAGQAPASTDSPSPGLWSARYLMKHLPADKC